ncbi:MAG: aspartyl protease family protein [bacterium]|nr:aspartyl protease family protein [bacterium]
MKFDYSKITLPERSDFFGSFILKAIIPVRIAASDHSLQYNALVDSGADFSISHREIGQALGLDVESGDKLTFGGVQKADAATAYLHQITLVVGGWKYTTTVGFSDEIAEDSYGILGQKGFFDIFVVKFDLVKESIELKERK